MSNPTQRGKYQLLQLGEGLNTWGVSGLNTGVFERMDEALHGVLEIALTSTSYTLTATNYVTNDIRFKQIKFTGNYAATINIPASTQNWWIVQNTTGQTLTFSNGSNTATLNDTFYGMVVTNGTAVDCLMLPSGPNAQTVADNILSVNQVATDSTSVIAVAGKSTEIGRLGTTAAVADLAALGGTQEVASLNALSPRAADIGTLADIEDGTVATDAISNLAPKAADITTLAPKAADIETLAHIEDGTVATTAISSLAPRASDIQALAPREADLNTLSGQASNIGTLADIEDGTVATNAISNLGPRHTDIQSLAPRASDLQSLGPRATDIQNLAPREADLATLGVASVRTDIATLADIEDGTTATNAISNLGPRATDIQSLAPRASDLQTLGTSPLPANITTVAGIGPAVSSVANSEASVNSFGKSYSTGAGTINTRGDGSGSSPATGDLRFNQTTSKMVVYDGASWVAAGSATNNIIEQQSYTATAGQTTFPATGTISYNSGFGSVWLNGVKLVNGTDVDISSGSNIVLSSGAAVGDVIDFIGYGTFVVANTYTQAQTNTLLADKAPLASPNFSGTPQIGGSNIITAATVPAAGISAGKSIALSMIFGG